MAEEKNLTPTHLWSLLGVAVTAFVAGWIAHQAVQSASGLEVVTREHYEEFQSAKSELPQLRHQLALFQGSDIPRMLTVCQAELAKSNRTADGLRAYQTSTQEQLRICKEGRQRAEPLLLGSGYQLIAGKPPFDVTKGGEIRMQFLGWRDKKAVIRILLNEPKYAEPVVEELGVIDFRGLRWVYNVTRTSDTAGYMYIRSDYSAY
jgi:hypothetical protein